MSMPKSHPAIVTPGPRKPLEILEVPTPTPTGDEVLVKNLWTASTPLDMHQAEAGLVISSFPARLGDGVGGIVVSAGPSAAFKRNNLVFGFTWRKPEEKAYQDYVLAPSNILGRVPAGWESRLQELVTVPNNFVTAWHLFIMDLGLTLPWPKPADESSKPGKDVRILIWGGSSSVGQYALQILRYYGFTNVVATASPRNFQLVKDCGAAAVVDYNSKDIRTSISKAFAHVSSSDNGQKSGDKTDDPIKIDLILDCIGSLDGSIKPIASLAMAKHAKVAILLPVIVRDATDTVEPIYSFDVREGVDWPESVDARGVRTHFYLDNEFNAKHLQPDIMPALLAEGIVKPNRTKIVEGKTLLARAQKAIDMLRRKEVSGERLVWKVAEN